MRYHVPGGRVSAFGAGDNSKLPKNDSVSSLYLKSYHKLQNSTLEITKIRYKSAIRSLLYISLLFMLLSICGLRMDKKCFKIIVAFYI